MEKTNNITAPASQSVLQNHLSDIFLDNYKTQNRFWQFGKAPESSKGYRTISWARSSIVNYTPADVLLVEGQVPTGSDGNIGLVTVLPIQYGDITKISDVLIEMSRLSIVEKRTRDLSEGAHRVIDKIIQNELLTNGINVRYGGSKTARNQLTADDKISLLDVSVMSTFLSEKGAPEFEGGNYVCIADNNVLHDLRTVSGTNTWIDVHKYTSFGVKNIYNGEIGTLFGVRFVKSNNLIRETITNVDSDEITVHFAYFLGREAYGVGELQAFKTYYVPNTPTTSNPIAQFAIVGWKCDFASVILNQDGLARLEVATSTDFEFGNGTLT